MNKLDLEEKYEEYLEFCKENNFKHFTFEVFKFLMEANLNDRKRNSLRAKRKDS